VDTYAKTNKIKPPSISNEACGKLMKYNYPGNVRELKGLIDLACVMSDGKKIEATDINFISIKGTEEFTAIEKTMKEYNWDIIQFYLKKYNNNVMLVANKLQIGKSTIYNFLKNPEVNTGN
jgi:DNA-binding NtrC family response regulator